MTCKNITRYTYETAAFQGYRLAICKNKRLFTRYFSDSQYGGADAAVSYTHLVGRNGEGISLNRGGQRSAAGKKSGQQIEGQMQLHKENN